MRKFTLLFSLLVMFFTASMAETLTVEINKNTGEFTSGNAAGTWNSEWSSFEVPDFTFSVSANNMAISDEHDYLRLYVGTVSPSHYVMTAPTGYCVSSYSFDFVKDGEYTNDVTLTAGGVDYVPSDEAQHVEVTGLKEQTASFVFAGANKGIILSNFVVVLESVTTCSLTYEYVLNGEVCATETVDAIIGASYPAPSIQPYGITFTAPEGEVTGDETIQIECSYDNSITFASDYASVRKWYYMTIHSTNKWYIGYTPDQEFIPAGGAGAVREIPEGQEDSYTWAFVGNPFAFEIVNMAAGEAYVLSASDPSFDGNTGGSTYPTLQDKAYLGDGYNQYWYAMASPHAEGGLFIYQYGLTYALNTRNPALAFWTGGADAGSTVILTVRDTNQASNELLEALEAAIEDADVLLYDEAGYAEVGGEAYELQVEDKSAPYYLWTNAQEAGEGPIANLIDGDAGTYFHTRWSDNGSSDDGLDHFIEVNLGEEVSEFSFSYITRASVANDYPAEMTIQGSNDGVNYTDIVSLTGLPKGSNLLYESEPVKADEAYSHLRFVVTKTSTDRVGSGTLFNYWHMAEFQLTTPFFRTVDIDEYMPYMSYLQELYALYLQAQELLANPDATEFLVEETTAELVELTAYIRKLASESEDEETVALLAHANSLISKVGVGYPSADARETFQAVIDEVTEKPTTANALVLQAAIDEYLSTTDVVMPEAGKHYTFTMVAKNGNRFYLNYVEDVDADDNPTADIAIVPVEEGVVYPSSAAFLCEESQKNVYGEDGETVESVDEGLAFTTVTGKYLVYHSNYNGISWLEGNGNTTGIQDVKDDMSHIKMQKITPSSSVVGEYSDLFGLLAWYSLRGYRVNSDGTRGAAEVGAVVIKSDGSNYDGASAPFWNDGYSSAFLVEECDPNELAIEEIATETVVKGIYDLSGRRVENLVKGIYIVNGKKVLVK